MAEKEGITAETTFREWYTTPGTGHVTEGAKSALRSVGKVPQEDGTGVDFVWRFHRDTFLIPEGAHGEQEPRELVAAYAVYRRTISRLGGDPGDYERPVADWK